MKGGVDPLFCFVFLRGAGVCLRIDLRGCEAFSNMVPGEGYMFFSFGGRTRNIMNNFILTLCDALTSC